MAIHDDRSAPRRCPKGLYATYAADPGPTWEFVSADSVGEFGGAEQLHRIAVDNLRRRGDIRVEGGNGRFALTVPDEIDLTASILLDAERWRAAVTIPGDLVVAAPTRPSVWACSAEDTESIDKLVSAAANGFANGEGKPVSQTCSACRAPFSPGGTLDNTAPSDRESIIRRPRGPAPRKSACAATEDRERRPVHERHPADG